MVVSSSLRPGSSKLVRIEMRTKEIPKRVAVHSFDSIAGSPRGFRTPVSAVRGRCPRPLDDGTAELLNTKRRAYCQACIQATAPFTGAGNRENTESILPQRTQRAQRRAKLWHFPKINPERFVPVVPAKAGIDGRGRVLGPSFRRTPESRLVPDFHRDDALRPAPE
jgi:hypothetical protein